MRKSIAGKLMLALGIVFVLSFSGLIAYNLVNLFRVSLKEGQLRAQEQSLAFVNDLTDQFDRTISMVETLSSTLLQMRAYGGSNRDYVVSLMEDLLQNRPELLGIYTLWEPDAFDGNDALFVNGNDYHDATGRFIPYVVRSQGQILTLPIHSYNSETEGSFYHTPKSSKQFALIEPYWYSVNGAEILMTSLVFPLLDKDGSFLGIVGADFELNFVQREIEKIHPLEGYATIITEQHNYLAHGQDRSRLLQPYDNPVSSKSESQWLNDQMTAMFLDTSGDMAPTYRLYYPIEIENALWHLEIVIPKSKILKPFRQALRDSLLISFLALAAVIAIMIFLIRRIVVHNIRRVIAISSAMADGDLRQRLDIRSGDEFETMAGHFNRMVSSREEAENLIRYQAMHDTLTDLYNRNGFYKYVQERLNQKPPDELAALMFIDLDHFKLINDTLNHEKGDDVLIEVSRRIRDVLSDNGLLFRFGGDEFLVMLDCAANKEKVVESAIRINRALALPFILQERPFYISASIGIVIDTWSSFGSIDSKIKEADTAMYVAKKERNSYRIFDSAMNYAPSKEIMLENDLYRALEEEQFELYYQPKVDFSTERIYGVEALIRWKHPELGIISPLDFIPIAEKTGLINPLGEWVIRTACRQNRKWQDMGLPPLTVAVNISMIQFQHAAILEMIRNNIETAHIRPHMLELELTESVFMNNRSQTLTLLRQLKEMGVQISLDDFGTGYSSLSYLKNIPLDYLKLDKSFISNITTDRKEQMIVKSVIVIAHNLGFKVVTEGVETQEQFDILKKHLCDGMQGYYFSPPLPAGKFQELLRSSLTVPEE
ncbi:EAL domain-containing protein [Paenibacillus sp. J5C_2022]|uniref:bifunctional diguanylate cyclase/phosphodiesterase n=1 Tax=Paenibacillus sp. J5C2022 TaxID=2977129 RepID=UPI0021D0E113|nr:EAL domain-containing protein [Paenibacillus sp. J5C2022]MCU6707338.1 EAL domain-containing protein [Paenibacillus sp. J5C2022]